MTGLDMAITRAPGFTLIELVAVIVVVAILAAISVPRFLDVAKDARIAKLNGALGSMRAASELAHLKQQMVGAAHNSPVVMGGATVTMINFYPTANATGIPVAAGVTTTDFTFTALGPNLDLTLNGAPDPGNCKVTYQRAPINGTPSFPPLVTTGC